MTIVSPKATWLQTVNNWQPTFSGYRR